MRGVRKACDLSTADRCVNWLEDADIRLGCR